MANRTRVKGITVEIGGDVTKLDKALAGTNKALSETKKSLRDVERQLKVDPKNTVLLEQKQRLLAQAVEESAQKVKILRQAMETADQALQRGQAYQEKYEPLKAELDKVTASMKGLEANADSMAAKLESGAISTEQYDAFAQKLENTRKRHEELRQAVKDLDKEFAGARMDQGQYDALYRTLIENERELKDLTTRAKESTSQLQKLSTAAGNVATAAGKIKSVFSPISSVAGKGLAAIAAAVPLTQELRTDLSKLDNNARQAAVGVDAARDAFRDLNTVSGETDSSIEAVSNLLQAGFTESNLQRAVEGLANAAITFPDTLKIESLADSLQETLATGTAVGQFGELLDRVGIGAETFSNNLALCTTDAEKQALALSVLVDGPLRGAYEGWRQNNQELTASRESSLQLQESIAQLAEKVQPLVTQLTELAAEFLDWFSSLDSGAQKAVVGMALLVAGISPVAGAVEAASTAFPALIGLLDSLGVRGSAAAAIFILLAALALQVADAWDSMTGLQKVVAVLGLLAAAALTAAIAFGAFQSAFTMGLAIAGIVAGIAAVTAAVAAARQQADSMANSVRSSGQSGLPMLASGAVIPPNQPFAAILGDQTTGRNIETPEALMRQVVREESGAKAPAAQTVVIEFTGSLSQLARVMKPELDRQAKLHGTSLVVKGGS